MSADDRAAAAALRIEVLFHELLESSPDAREARLAEEAARDPGVAARVRALLRAAGEAEGFFTGLPGRIAAARADEGVAALEGRRVGAYVIDGLIGRGGMGAVYRAHRADEHFEKSVAIKLVPVGLLSEAARERFRRERQTLARLEHPHIARLLDGGVLDDATPYLVMELIEGRPIDRWCDEKGLGVHERVRLALDVIEAVQFAHQSLVLHSDIKPDNVLVSERGGAKLLDFGIARSLDEASPESTLTRRSSPVTPAYASPEQLRGDVLTTASDVHALGALLYALLAGRAPFTLTGKSTAEIERIVAEQMPAAPSAVAPADRATALRGDLDTIVLRALQKEPARRYASAGALADDLRAHLEGRPIAARRDSARYVFSRFVRRHRAVVASVTGALVLVVGFAFTLAALSGRHAREVSAERDRARREARTAEAVADFLATLFDGSDPDVAGGRDLTARELMDQSARRLEGELASQPEVRARMSTIMATLYEKLGRREEALALIERAVAIRADLPGGDPLRRAGDLEIQATLFRSGARFAAAESVLAQAEALRRGLGADSAALAPVLAARAYLASDLGQDAVAESLLDIAESLHARAARPDTGALAQIADYRGYLALFARGAPQEAESLFARSAELYSVVNGPNHSQVVSALKGRGQALLRIERYAEAESLLRWVVEHHRRILGPDHVETISAELYLGNALASLDRFDEGEASLRHVLDVRMRTLGAGNANTINVLNMLGLLYRESGDDDRALEYLHRAADGYERLGGPWAARGKPIIENNIASVLVDAGRFAEAEPLLRRLRASPCPPQTAYLQDLGLARAAQARGDLARAESEMRRLLARAQEPDAGIPPRFGAATQVALGRLLLGTRRAEEAATLLGDAVATLASTVGPDQMVTLQARVLLAGALSASGRIAEADTLLARAHEAITRGLPAGHVQRREADAIARAHAARRARAG